MVVTVDGVSVFKEAVEGNIDYQYAHGETVVRVKVTAGEHAFRASFPEFAGMADPQDNMNTDGRRKLFIDYVDVVGPFAVAGERARPLFVCSEETAECAVRILGRLARRAYRRPVTEAELGALTGLAAQVRNAGDSFAESIRVGVQAVLLSPHFLFRAEPVARTAEAVSAHELAARLSYFLWSSMPDDLLAQAVDIHGIKVLAVILENADVNTLRAVMDKMKDKLKTAAIVLASVSDGKVTLIAGVTADSTSKVKAGDLVNFVAQQVGGKGGGRPDMAQAGGTDPSGLPKALAGVSQWVSERVST
jgi:hypothetical protein